MTSLLPTLCVLLIANFITVNHASVIPNKLDSDVKITLVTSEEMKDILKLNPNAIPLERKVHAIEAKETKYISPRYTIEYFLGARTTYDFLVARDGQSHSYGQAQNVQMTLQYPAQGVGYIVTFVDILVSQSNNQGNAYIISGGIGYRQITVVVEAYGTTYFDYDAFIYGQN